MTIPVNRTAILLDTGSAAYSIDLAAYDGTVTGNPTLDGALVGTVGILAGDQRTVAGQPLAARLLSQDDRLTTADAALADHDTRLDLLGV